MLGQGHLAPPALNCLFTQESCMVARLIGRERNPCEHAPPACALALIGYTTRRDAIITSAPRIPSSAHVRDSWHPTGPTGPAHGTATPYLREYRGSLRRRKRETAPFVLSVR